MSVRRLVEDVVVVRVVGESSVLTITKPVLRVIGWKPGDRIMVHTDGETLVARRCGDELGGDEGQEARAGRRTGVGEATE